MQRRQSDANPTAFNAADTRHGDLVDVVVLSNDESLLQTLQQAVGTSHTMWHAASADAAVELLLSGHSGILIADLAILHSDAAALLERLLAQFPEMVLLATGRRDQEGAVAPLITKGSVYRFLHKPVSPARASLFLATATRRYYEITSNGSQSLATVRQLTGPSNRLGLIGGGIAAVITAAAVVWFIRSPHVSQTPSTATSTAAISQRPSKSVGDQLDAAKAAFDAGRLSEPVGDNALDRYRGVLAVDPTNATAQAGVTQVLVTLTAQVEQALQAQQAPVAARALKALQVAQPDHPQLQTLRDKLFALSRSTSAEPVVTRTQAAARPAISAIAAVPNSDQARLRLQQGQLLAPADDSALLYLQQARAQSEDGSMIRVLATDLGSRLLDQARAAIAASNVEEARAGYSAAIDVDREFELALPDLADVGRQLDELISTQTHGTSAAISQLLAPAIKFRETSQLLEPAGDNAFDVLTSLSRQYPDSAEVRAESQRLASTLLEHARTSVVSGDLARAELLVARADTLIPEMSATQSLREQITTARSQQQNAALNSTVLNGGQFARTREVPATYPSDAQLHQVEGWVDLEFTIDSDGVTRNISVVDAQPSGVFNRAAVDAMRKWRYEPILRNGVAVEQRAKLRMQFKLQ